MGGAATPLVSVVMSVFNGATYVREAVDSILHQTYDNLELLVVDDASTDTTPQILAGIADARLRVLTNDANLGLTRSLNRAIAEVRGELIARQDADDVSLPGRLARQVAFLAANPSVGLLGGAFEVIEAGGRHIDTCVQPAADMDIRWKMLFENAFCHSAVMFRATLATDCREFYDPCISFAQDYHCWSNLLTRTRGANLADPIVRYRVHAQAVSSTRLEEQQKTAGFVSSSNMSRILKGGRLDDAAVEQLRKFYGSARQELAGESLERVMLLFLRLFLAHLCRFGPAEFTTSQSWKWELKRIARLVVSADLPAPARMGVAAQLSRAGLFALWRYAQARIGGG